jgi:hypothetical protein
MFVAELNGNVVHIGTGIMELNSILVAVVLRSLLTVTNSIGTNNVMCE